MNASHETSEKLKTELEDLQSEISAVGPLLDKLEVSQPDGVEIRAVATTLHAFYNGVERIFLIIAKGIDDQVPQSVHWHRELLDQMKDSTERRAPVVDEKLHERLVEYLGFRHFFRHSYPMQLNWQLMEGLTKNLRKIHEELAASLKGFIEEQPKARGDGAS